MKRWYGGQRGKVRISSFRGGKRRSKGGNLEIEQARTGLLERGVKRSIIQNSAFDTRRAKRKNDRASTRSANFSMQIGKTGGMKESQKKRVGLDY